MLHTISLNPASRPARRVVSRADGFRSVPRGIVVAVASLAFAGVLTACGADGTARSAAHNDADVSFASDMIIHHEQAIEMAQMVDDNTVDPAVADLADRIEAAQAPEIELMTGWLEEWDEPVPDQGAMDHSNMEGMDGMAGMMTAEDMAALEAADGAAFQTMWLEMMIEHHQGAVEMARSVLDEGQYEPARKVAETIIETQQAEIEEMEGLLG